MNKEDYSLRVSVYGGATRKEVKNELERQNGILAELTQFPEENAEDISAVEQNIAALKLKRNHIAGELAGKGIDKTIRTILWVILIVYCVSLLILPIWMFLTSLKDPLEYATSAFAFPKSFNFDNYKSVFEKLQITIDYQTTYTLWDMAGFSILYSVGVSLMSVILTTCMAYVIAKYKFPGRNFLYSLGIVIMIIPIVGNLPSAMVMRKALGTYDNIVLTILTSPCTAFSGLYFLLLHGAFKQLPWDYAEAVFVDGGGHYSAFFRMYLPMILPTMTVIFVLNLLGAWNDYMTFMLWLPSTPNLAYGLYLFQGVSRALYKSSITEIMAGFTLVIIPTVIMYLASQKLILSKFTVGGLKG